MPLRRHHHVPLLLLLLIVGSVLVLVPAVSALQLIHRHADDHTEASASISIDMTKPLVNESQDLWGVFFEEINHAGVGGLYHQLLNNSNFEVAGIKYEQDGTWDSEGHPRRAFYDPWFLLPPPAGQQAWIAVARDFPLNGFNPYSISVQSTGAAGTVTLVNPGFWGINTIGVSTFTVSFYALARPGVTPPTQFIISVYSNKAQAVYASTVISADSLHSSPASWQQFNATFKMTASGTDPAAYFSISWLPSADAATTMVYFDLITLFPDSGWNGLPYIRADLGQMVADLHPAFMRFPGGCYVEGGVLGNRFNWRTSVGPIENRPGHWGIWSYYSEDHLGLFEYLSFIEKLTDAYGNPTRAIWVVNSGNSHFLQVPSDELGQWVQDALDSIEFIIGPTTTYYGAMRAAMGHPEPFTSLTHVAIGNEGNLLGNWQQVYVPNYAVLYAALKAAYPQLTYIANDNLEALTPPVPTELYDFHHYDHPAYFFQNSYLFDSYSRSGPKIFNSEYAVIYDCGQGNAIAGLAEAAWMTGVERNSDLITTASYAPLFVNANDRSWNPDAIVFDTYRVYGTPSYWTQWMFSNANLGTIGGSVQTLQYEVTAAGSSSDAATTPTLFAIATWARLNSTVSVEKNATNVLIVKVVNANTTSVSVALNVNVPAGASFNNPTVDVWTLAATSSTQENSFDQPTAIAPVFSTLTWPLPSTVAFAALSTTAMRVYFTM